MWNWNPNLRFYIEHNCRNSLPSEATFRLRTFVVHASYGLITMTRQRSPTRLAWGRSVGSVELGWSGFSKWWLLGRYIQHPRNGGEQGGNQRHGSTQLMCRHFSAPFCFLFLCCLLCRLWAPLWSYFWRSHWDVSDDKVFELMNMVMMVMSPVRTKP